MSNPRVEPNKIVGLVRPTVPAGEKEFKKFDFNEQFDHAPFTAMLKEYELNKRTGAIKVGKDRKPKIVNAICTHG